MMIIIITEFDDTPGEVDEDDDEAGVRRVKEGIQPPNGSGWRERKKKKKKKNI
jgi:hypothetical protein